MNTNNIPDVSGWKIVLKLSDVMTWDHLYYYLIERKMDGAVTPMPSLLNPSFTKETVWWYWFNECRTNAGKDIEPDMLPKVLEAVSKDF